MSLPLPNYVGLTSKYNSKYLRYISEDTQVHGLLQFDGEELVTPYTKFRVEVAKTGNGLVHIRSVYNNKYWVRWSKNHWWIFAGADEPNEDQSSWSCTLFEPLVLDKADPYVIRLRHVQLGHFACLWRTSAPFTSCLFAGSASENKENCDVFKVTNLGLHFMLPKHITLKGNNGRYLSGKVIEKHPYLQFSSNNIDDSTVWYEAFINKDGSAGIRSDHFAKFWRRSPNWIWADSDDAATANPDTVFWPIEVDKTVVALSNLGNNNYCKRLTTEGKTDCLNAGVATITKEAKLELEETAIWRSINVVEFYLSDARIYDKNSVTLAHADAINESDEPTQVSFEFPYNNSITMTYNSSITRKLFDVVNIVAKAPTILSGNISVTNEINQQYKWGDSITIDCPANATYSVTVPPKTALKTSLIATKGSVDIPFKYDQKDTLLNGKDVTYSFNDGIYTGTNYYDFKYEIKEVPITVSD